MLTENGQKIAQMRDYVNSGATRSYDFRMEQIRKIKQMLTLESDRICEAIYKDTRRRPEFTEFYEIGVAKMECDQFLDNLKEWMEDEYVDRTLVCMLDTPYVRKEPFGVCLLISPFNYPINLTVPALIAMIAAGNSVILKPSELTPNTSALFEEMYHKYFDKRLIQVIQGDGPATAALLNERFDHICYTGSERIGKLVMAAVSKHLTPVVLELGGQSPVLVDETVDLEITARRILWGKTSNAGQTCLAPNHLITTADVKFKLLPILKRILVEFYGEDAQKSNDFMRLVSHHHFDRIKSMVDNSKGNVVIKAGEFDRDDLFIPPMIVEVDKDDVLLSEEIFGPILPIVTVAEFEDAFDLIKKKEKPLGAYIFSNDKKRQKKFVDEISTGNIGINDLMLNFAVDTLPFGGVGHSGMGRYRGKAGFDTFSNWKSVLHRGFFADNLTACRYPPCTPDKYKMMKRAGNRVVVPKKLKKLFSVAPWILLGVFFKVIYQQFAQQF
ncbi:unnamed protein product [Bursaphelenchus xylophilus]|uniref:Aldehyde dehydrogenase n=1 Tax=Bursaphelenchus xylophilus TaxID=6326 RepID=A0A1I7S594_BURXY|nr:unnamed protein product [Bursaphelenchus xylophilus]CAG9117834.1 unnamed protein product [Bursaphelenchus xylophilus]